MIPSRPDRDDGQTLSDLQRVIDRARRADGRLIAAYVDVDGLEVGNDSSAHHAGDARLRHIVAILQANLRSFESIVRLGDHSFVCTFSNITIDTLRQRFDEITAELSLTPDAGTIAVGLAELARGDSPMDLIDRADRSLITSRDTKLRLAGTGD